MIDNQDSSECSPRDFGGPSINNYRVNVGEVGPEIDYSFDQAPCSWTQTYEFEITGPKGEATTLPDFIESEETFLVVNEPSEADLGDYRIKVCSQLDNSSKTRECTEFMIIVQGEEGADVTAPSELRWNARLVN